jgi:hypothetical protein
VSRSRVVADGGRGFAASADRGSLIRDLLLTLRIARSGLLESRPSGIHTLAAEQFCFHGKDILDLLILAEHVTDGRAPSLHPVTLFTRL